MRGYLSSVLSILKSCPIGLVLGYSYCGATGVVFLSGHYTSFGAIWCGVFRGVLVLNKF